MSSRAEPLVSCISVTIAQRLTTLLRLPASVGVTIASPLSPRFLRQSLSEELRCSRH